MSENTPASAASEVQILQAKEVSIPVVAARPPVVSPELIQLRSDFFSGKTLTREELGTLMTTAEEGTPSNANCWLC